MADIIFFFFLIKFCILISSSTSLISNIFQGKIRKRLLLDKRVVGLFLQKFSFRNICSYNVLN